jgi:RyR domain
MDIEKIARVCHEANRGWCAAHGDHSQVTWEEAPQWQRESSIDSVKFALANPNVPDSGQHDSWMKLKLSEGWRYGKTKDALAKTHPSLVPFEQLPAPEQAKDRLFMAIVKALA